MNKLDILKSAIEGRNNEILEYQINIDNYTRAIAKIDVEHADNPAMVDFKARLQELLESSKTEQLKSIIMRDVIAEQVTEMEAS
jgi:hypothetical protein